MRTQSKPPIEMGTDSSGTLVYQVRLAPDGLPPVRSGDLAESWAAARQAATSSAWGEPRFFRFRPDETDPLDLALTDDDASCWAEAVDAAWGLHTAYGLSMCLRLLGLVALLSESPVLRALCPLSRGGGPARSRPAAGGGDRAALAAWASRRAARPRASGSRAAEPGLPHPLRSIVLIQTRCRAALALLVATGVAGCYRPPPPTRADTAVRTDCRQQVERQYNAQNRVDLTRRDDRDVAFANNYNSGIASRGLGAQYHREQMITDCLRESGDTTQTADPGVGPAFSPVGIGAGSSTLRP